MSDPAKAGGSPVPQATRSMLFRRAGGAIAGMASLDLVGRSSGRVPQAKAASSGGILGDVDNTGRHRRARGSGCFAVSRPIDGDLRRRRGLAPVHGGGRRAGVGGGQPGGDHPKAGDHHAQRPEQLLSGRSRRPRLAPGRPEALPGRLRHRHGHGATAAAIGWHGPEHLHLRGDRQPGGPGGAVGLGQRQHRDAKAILHVDGHRTQPGHGWGRGTSNLRACRVGLVVRPNQSCTVSGESNTGSNCSSGVTVTVSGGGGGISQTCAVGLELNPGDGCSGSGYTLRNDASVLVVNGNIGGVRLSNARFSGSVNLNNLNLARSGNVWTIVNLP